MSEYELLDLLMTSRAQLDAAIAQSVALNFAMIVAIYYFLHRAGLMLKVVVFLLYTIGWFVFVGSGWLSGQQMVGVVTDLVALTRAGEAGAATNILLGALNSAYFTGYLVAANAANFLLLVGSFVFLFFWKPPKDRS